MGLRLLEVADEPLTLEVTLNGFYGAAFVTPANQVIIAFEGTYLSALARDPLFVAAQIEADRVIAAGGQPDAYGDALRFAEAVQVAALAQGIPATEIFVTGHSLGGAEAAYVAAQLDLPGETYGAPGIAAAAIPEGAISQLVNYVERGDPVGNYSANPDLLNGFLQSQQILRFGEPSYLGDLLPGLALIAVGEQFGPGTTPEENAAGLAALVGLAAEYHVLGTYAADLGVTLEDPGEDLSGFAFV